MGRKKKSRNPMDYVALPDFEINDRAKRSIIIVVILALGIISFLGLFNLSGHFGQFVSKMLTLGFGYGRWLVPFLFLYWAFVLIRGAKKTLKFSDYLGLGLLFVSYQTLFHFFIDQKNWLAVVKLGEGGGYVGYYLSRLFLYVVGFWGGVIVLVAFFLISLVLVFNTSLERIVGRESILAKIFKPFALFFKALFSKSESEANDIAEEREELITSAREEVLSAWQKRDVSVVAEMEAEEDEEELAPVVKHKNQKPVQEKITWPKNSIKIDMPLELLNNKFSKAIGGDTDLNQQKIHNTLNKFGIEVEMDETKVGPTVTQYTFRPAEGVKLSRITTLSNDLSLALAAHPIRIEAPIPGKSLVGVEVPNRAKAIVGLREILEDEAFKQRKNNLYIALGKDVAGTAWLYDLTKMPHLLVAGATNSGKSVCLNAIIVSLLYQNNPDDLRFIMVDPKRVELPTYNGIPHLLTPVITEVSKTINSLKWCLNEMDRRYDLLNKSGKKNIQAYNLVAKEKLPYIVYIIDELADFMMTAGKEMEAAIIRLAQMSRAIGIHLILATQRPSVDVITGLIKANIPTRIAFSVASLVDSKTILDASGAEKLLGQGDMLFSTAELAKPKRIQGAYLSDNEINDVVNYIKDKSGAAEYLEGITDRQKVGGVAGVGLDGNHGDEDELFEEAKEIIVRAGKASTSMLQRRLSIGYGRAAKILDMLEEARIIGPSNGSKPREVLLSQEEYDEQGGLSGIPIHNRATTPAPENYFGGANESADEEDNEEGDDGVLDFGRAEDETSEEAAVEIEEEAAEELTLTPDEEEDVINDEDEILEEIREDAAREKKLPAASESKKPSFPPNDDDEMFFAK
ncbi:MAG: DNA translocase FtsK 4TM domain-containing protein [Candidatus Falkowbacteria bacterium]|nr:MAG: DNA translocase FtsK 4TM domain-containing protein [Candidatus Falkowbacteria bacterium]